MSNIQLLVARKDIRLPRNNLGEGFNATECTFQARIRFVPRAQEEKRVLSFSPPHRHQMFECYPSSWTGTAPQNWVSYWVFSYSTSCHKTAKLSDIWFVNNFRKQFPAAAAQCTGRNWMRPLLVHCICSSLMGIPCWLKTTDMAELLVNIEDNSISIEFLSS